MNVFVERMSQKKRRTKLPVYHSETQATRIKEKRKTNHLWCSVYRFMFQGITILFYYYYCYLLIYLFLACTATIRISILLHFFFIESSEENFSFSLFCFPAFYLMLSHSFCIRVCHDYDFFLLCVQKNVFSPYI